MWPDPTVERLSGVQRLARRLVSAQRFAAFREGTKAWLAECQVCGHLADVWDTGGIRYKAAGEPVQLRRCPTCDRRTRHRIRRKTEAERRALP